LPSHLPRLAPFQVADKRAYPWPISLLPHAFVHLPLLPQGVLDEYRRPKMAFDAVRAGFATGRQQQQRAVDAAAQDTAAL
jgi:pyrrolidone-carboxylate peptidase